ncbi:MAG: hypothetical protein PVH41_16910 [Anaerolineae bacterium]|jgi:hypothetical protein
MEPDYAIAIAYVAKVVSGVGDVAPTYYGVVDADSVEYEEDDDWEAGYDPDDELLRV